VTFSKCIQLSLFCVRWTGKLNFLIFAFVLASPNKSESNVRTEEEEEEEETSDPKRLVELFRSAFVRFLIFLILFALN
jgi:hypothetical protein